MHLVSRFARLTKSLSDVSGHFVNPAKPTKTLHPPLCHPDKASENAAPPLCHLTRPPKTLHPPPSSTRAATHPQLTPVPTATPVSPSVLSTPNDVTRSSGNGPLRDEQQQQRQATTRQEKTALQAVSVNTMFFIVRCLPG